LATAYALKYVIDAPDMYLPGFFFEIPIGWWYVPIAAFIIVAESNAVNFTDGLDGLAGLIAATAIAAFGGIALMQEQLYLARFVLFWSARFSVFYGSTSILPNSFMGDTGSMALGSVLAVIALMTGQWPMLLVIGIIPLAEMLSVVIQIAYFQMDGRQALLQDGAHPPAF
jgi:phospho-N-acetylmuramoyl-pentapeptide-transferase